MDLVISYFPELTEKQIQLFDRAIELYVDWNTKVNLISRNDMENLVERHILHSLSIAKVIQFVPGTKIMDVGTGGGFPGIPLAILFPEVDFYLIDTIGKKIKVVQDIVESLQLKNVKAEQKRAEDVKNQQFDFVVSRAVTRLPDFVNWVKYNISKKQKNSLRNGILYIKGGDVLEEIAYTGKKYSIIELSGFFKEPFFETKKVIHLY
ncbi:MAG TPA: 16S rRNA (guanine(527)-N(7))-methyltransferase RsmG [Bacteroidales bacterium]|nr:16S rRNA (guanine(527)-N(7))-methyltransferase RsmG [Bacteroidales bacterium]